MVRDGKSDTQCWLDEEEFLTRQLARFTEKTHYTVARQHDLENFYELLFSPKPKFYLSYPITLLRDTPKEIEKIREIGEKLSRSFIVFDPLTIKDMALVTAGGEVGSDTLGLPTTMMRWVTMLLNRLKHGLSREITSLSTRVIRGCHLSYR